MTSPTRYRYVAAAAAGSTVVLALAVWLARNEDPVMSAREMTLPGMAPFPQAVADQLWRAFASKPESYRPRTHHLEADGTPKYINRLITASSPYLLQHAHNPVDWHPWGADAFEEAKRRGIPVLLSVGYSTCHWCHVMERESFEDEEIAAFVNAHFVAIKVDREERPDVDAVYMTAVQLMRGGGGWPMTVFLTPDKAPFFAGTYFPARDGDRGSSIGFLTVLDRLSQAWRSDRSQVESEAARLTKAVRSANQPQPPEGVPGEKALVEAARFLGRIFDEQWGGFGRAPKFPRPSTYELLLRYHRRSGDPAALQVVRTSVDRMYRGGMYDHLGGGFARYSTDRAWLVPHFEKMLYDNAQLVVLLTELWQSTGDDDVLTPLRETLTYVAREMTHPEGGFYSATDADSEGEEGRFFTWTPAEIADLLGPTDAEVFNAAYGVVPQGHLDGRSVLHLPEPLNRLSEDTQAALARDRERLRRHREERPHPLLDDKVLTEWNAQMISAFARAGFALNDPELVRRADRAGRFLSKNLQKDGSLQRAWRLGKVSGEAVLEDYAFLTAAWLDLFEVTAQAEWLDAAEATMAGAIERFWDDDGGAFFGTSSEGEVLLVRDKPSYDGAQPSGNSVAALSLLRLAALTGDSTYLERADRTLLAFGRQLAEGAVQNPKMALALDWRLDRAKEIVVVLGDDGGEDLLSVLRTTFVPNAVRVIASEAAVKRLESRIEWLEGKITRGGRTTAYVCLEGVCKAPTSDPETFRTQLDPEVGLEAPPMRLGKKPSPSP